MVFTQRNSLDSNIPLCSQKQQLFMLLLCFFLLLLFIFFYSPPSNIRSIRRCSVLTENDFFCSAAKVTPGASVMDAAAALPSSSSYSTSSCDSPPFHRRVTNVFILPGLRQHLSSLRQKYAGWQLPGNTHFVFGGGRGRTYVLKRFHQLPAPPPKPPDPTAPAGGFVPAAGRKEKNNKTLWLFYNSRNFKPSSSLVV